MSPIVKSNNKRAGYNWGNVNMLTNPWDSSSTFPRPQMSSVHGTPDLEGIGSPVGSSDAILGFHYS